MYIRTNRSLGTPGEGWGRDSGSCSLSLRPTSPSGPGWSRSGLVLGWFSGVSVLSLRYLLSGPTSVLFSFLDEGADDSLRSFSRALPPKSLQRFQL